jgi:hypothetical protein
VLAGMCARSQDVAKQITSTPGFFPVARALLLPQQDLLTSSRDSISIRSLTASDELVKDTLFLLQSMLPKVQSRDLELVYPEIKTVHKWQWEDDYHNFSNYDEHSASLLEERYKAGDSNYTIRIRNSSYKVDFNNMKQYNASTQVMRNVQRDPIWTKYTRRVISTTAPPEETHDDESESPKSSPKEKKSNIVSRLFKKKRLSTSPKSPVSPSDHTVFDDNITVLFLKELLEPLMQVSTSANVDIKQDAVVAASQIICSSNHELLKTNCSPSMVANFITRLVSSGESVCETHGLLLAEKLIRSMKVGSQFMKCFHREGLVRTIRETTNDNRKLFLERNFPNSEHLDELISEEEKILEQVTKQLHGQHSTALGKKLVELFTNEEALSTYQFVKSRFAQAMLAFVGNQSNLAWFVTLMKENSTIMPALVTMLNAALCSCEKFESIETQIEAEDLERLASTVTISVGKKSVQATWLVTVWELEKKFITKKNAYLSFNGHALEPYQTIYEVVKKYSKQKFDDFHSLLDEADTFKFVQSEKKRTNKVEENQLPENVLPYLKLLKTLNQVNLKEKLLTVDAFYNLQLTSKITHQLTSPDAIALACCGSLPQWSYTLTREYPFLFSFETRRLFFYFAAFGASKTVTNEYAKVNEEIINRKKLIRTKIQARENVLAEAIEIMKNHAGAHATMEYEYEGEAGIGLGPTLEFYTLVSRELQKKSEGLFYSSNSDSEFVTSEFGLFPHFDLDAEKLAKFRFTGQLVGKVLEDNRLLSMHFATPFLRAVQGEDQITLEDYQQIDSYIFNSVKYLVDMGEKLKKKEVDANAIENLGLDFTFHGVELIKDGGSRDVDSRNFEEYVTLLKQFLERECYKEATAEFRKGLTSVVDLSYLDSFTSSELRSLVCGNESLWNTREIIVNNIVCTHGYDAASNQVHFLVDIICELTPDLQRLFLEFVTGSTQLPVGGFPALSPKLTIAKREGTSPNTMLPTCNTCFHYLKLPEYSSKDIMKEKLLIAITMGRGSFELT